MLFRSVRGSPFYFSQVTFISRMMNSVRRMVEPYQAIYSLAQFEEFMNFSKNDVSGRHVIKDKFVGLFVDSEDYEETISEFKDIAQKSYWKEDTMFALCTKPAVARDIYQKYGSKYFTNPYDKNTLYFYNQKNRFERNNKVTIFDLSKLKSINYWLSTILVKSLQEMTPLNEVSFSGGVPLIVAFVDPLDEVNTQIFLDGLEPLGQKYLGRATFVWVDYRDYLDYKKKLGVEGVR